APCAPTRTPSRRLPRGPALQIHERTHRRCRGCAPRRRRAPPPARRRATAAAPRQRSARLWCLQPRVPRAKRRVFSVTDDATVTNGPLSREELRRLDAYWRAANYLSVGEIYLLDKPLLPEPPPIAQG